MSTQLQPIQWTDNPETLPSLVPASFHDSDDEDAGQNHIPIDIYQHFGLSPGTPICLDSLQDPAPGQKPAYTYATLVKLAIWSSPQRKLTLSGIYEALEKRFAWFRECENPNAWKTSIRHSLSLLSVFVKLPMDIHVPGKGCNWTVDFSKGDGYKRPRKRGGKILQKALEVSASEFSASTAAPSGSESGTPVDAPNAWTTNPQGWQTAEERANRVFAPYGKTIALAAASPDPQFRHYRMCTYLYPGTGGAPAPAPVKEVWDLVGETGEVAVQDESDPPARPRRTHLSRTSHRSDPLATTSRRGRKSSRHTASSQTTPEEEYFYPSAASYQAYRAASSAHPSTYVWHGNETPVITTKTSPECASTKQYRESSPEDDRDNGKNMTADDSVKDVSEPGASANVIDPELLGTSPRSASPPSESEFEEEDS